MLWVGISISMTGPRRLDMPCFRSHCCEAIGPSKRPQTWSYGASNSGLWNSRCRVTSNFIYWEGEVQLLRWKLASSKQTYIGGCFVPIHSTGRVALKVLSKTWDYPLYWHILTLPANFNRTLWQWRVCTKCNPFCAFHHSNFINTFHEISAYGFMFF